MIRARLETLAENGSDRGLLQRPIFPLLVLASEPLVPRENRPETPAALRAELHAAQKDAHEHFRGYFHRWLAEAVDDDFDNGALFDGWGFIAQLGNGAV